MPVPESRLAEIKKITFVILFLSLFSPIFSQQNEAERKEKRRVELLYCELLIDDIRSELRRLIGKVTLRHNDILMMCDSAHLFAKSNIVKAYSKVHIEQGDTLDLYGNYLFYDGNKEIAELRGNVELIDKDTHLYTESVDYDVNARKASYPKDGRIVNGDNTLTSKIGIYYANEKMFHFKDSVKIVNPDYTMRADTMQYNTESETAFFLGPSEMKGDSIYIYCERGWYDTKNDISRLWKNAVIDNMQQLVKGDSLHYDDKSGYGEAWRNISITDTTNNIIVKGDYAWYYREPEKFLVTKKAMFVQVSDGDSLYMHADTISAITLKDSIGNPYRLMRSYHGCRIFSNDLQAKCDSLSYSFQDSVIRMYVAPVLWSEKNQLTSDSIAIFTKDSNADRMEMYGSAFITSQVDSLRFDQIKGRMMTGYFRENKLYKVRIDGNGETIYYLADKEELVGVNHAKSSSIEIYLDDGKITDIFELQNPEGKLDPPLLNAPEKLRLDGFNWLDWIRPKDKNDIFRK